MSTSRADLERLALRIQLPGLQGPSLSPDAAGLVDDGLGGFCLFGSTTAAGADGIRAVTSALRSANPDAIVAVDEEGGDVTRVHAATGSPSPGNAVLGAVDDLGVTHRAARAIGLELRSLGITLDLAPVADANTNPGNPIIGVRSFGADPDLVARHTAAWTEGLQSAGVSACAKHFPGHGDTVADSHTDLPTVDVTVEEMRARELLPFTAAIAAGTHAVMTSHILVPALDPLLPATLSPTVLRFLRDDLAFGGCIVTDALDMAGAQRGRGIPRAAVLAVAAGADLLCLGSDTVPELVRAVQEALVLAVESGDLEEARLVDAASRVDTLARAYAGESPSREPAPVDLDRVGDDAGDDAARQALRVEGTLPDLAGALVVTVATEPTIAVGDVPWGLEPDLVLDATDTAATLLTAAQGRPVVLQVRDAHRHADVTDLVTAVAERQPRLVVVEWGWPGEPPAAVTRICTLGASLPSTRAVDSLLRTAGLTR